MRVEKWPGRPRGWGAVVSRAYLPTGTVCRGEARGMDTVCKSVAVGRGHARVVARVPENTCGTTKVCSSRHLPMHRVPAGCRGLSRGAGALGVGVQRGVDMPERCSGARPRERAGAARKFGPRVRRPAGPGSVQKDGDGPSPSFGYSPEVRSDLRGRVRLGAESAPAGGGIAQVTGHLDCECDVGGHASLGIFRVWGTASVKGIVRE